MALWRKRMQWYNIVPNDRCVRFNLNSFGVSYNNDDIYYLGEHKNVLLINALLAQNDNAYRKIVDVICEFKPKWMQAQPFILNKLLQTYKKIDKLPPKSLLYIESVGEILSNDLRRRVTDFFGVDIADMYGSEEMNGIALENREKQFGVLTDNVHIEVMRNDIVYGSGDGEAIITNINNFAMPLIRYNQGDKISIEKIIDKEKFVIDKYTYKISLLSGRSCESINLLNYEITQLLLVDIISEVNNAFGDCITDYGYIYYKSKNTIVCNIVVEKIRTCFFQI